MDQAKWAIKQAAKNKAVTSKQRQADTILALDRASIRTKDADGHLHVALTPISKSNVCGYRGHEIPQHRALGLDPDKTYQLLRDPEELRRAAASFSGKPLLHRHRSVTADDHDHELTVGAVTGAMFKYPFLMAALDIWDGSAIKAIEDGSQRELSCGYRYRADMTPGTYEGVRYDGVMRDIQANHVAVVPVGRAGKDVYVHDSKQDEGDITDMDMTKVETVLGYLCSMLNPDQQAELSTLLGSGTDVPDVIGDAIKGKIAADRMPPRIKRAVAARTGSSHNQAGAASFMEQFPDNERLR